MAILTVITAVAFAVVPDGPRLAAIQMTPGSMQSGLTMLSPTGRRHERLLTTPVRTEPGSALIGGPTWSPDGTMLAFAGVGHGESHHMIFLLPAAGGSPQAIPGTRGGFLPVFSPEGRTLAFTRIARKGPHRYRWGTRWDFESASVWIVDLQTGESRQLTRSSNDLDHYASSFSPDGKILLVTRWDIERSQDLELVALRLDGGPSSLLVGEGASAVYSPDGSKIALFRIHERRIKLKDQPPTEFGTAWRVVENLELYVVNADGSHLRRLTHTPHKDEFFASWDPSGERIAYSRFRLDRFVSPNSVMQINVDGTCPTKVLSRRDTVFYGPVWQPGPGREAGRISC